MDAINDPSCDEVVLMSSAQVGKTEVINNIAGYFIAHDPGPMMVIQPTLEMGEAWSKDRFAPMVRDTPALSELVTAATARSSGNTLRHKSFPGGHLTVSGANSPASLASRPIRILLADERDRWPTSVGSEGDPWRLARKRTTTFWNAVKVQVSTPTIKGLSPIAREYDASSRGRFYVPCPECGEHQCLRWAQVTWTDRDPDTAGYACEECGALWSDAQRWQAVRRGEWRHEDPSNRKRGFHLSELYSPWVSLAAMVESFLGAKRHPHLLQTFINLSLGEPWEDRGAELDHEVIYNRRASWEELPADAVLITGGVDVQKDRLEVELVAWNRNEESWSVHYEQVMGDPHRDEVWQRLTDTLRQEFPHASGKGLPVTAVCIDTGGHHTSEVYRYCRGRAGVHAVKGKGGAGYPAIITSSVQKPHGVRLWSVGVDQLKARVMQNLSVTAPSEGGYCHFPLTRQLPYFVGLTSEKRVEKVVNGRMKLAWVQIPNTNNEPLDLRVYAMAAKDMMTIHWDVLEANLNNEPEPEAATLPSPTRPSRRRPGSGNNWVTSW